MSQKFKAGDRIRCINIPYKTDDLTVDAIYTVTKVGNSMDANAPYMIMNNGDQLWTSGWKEMFELVEKEMSFKDKVFEYASSDSRSVDNSNLITSLAQAGVFTSDDEEAKASLIEWIDQNPEDYCDAGLEKVRKHFELEPPKPPEPKFKVGDLVQNWGDLPLGTHLEYYTDSDDPSEIVVIPDPSRTGQLAHLTVKKGACGYEVGHISPIFGLHVGGRIIVLPGVDNV